MASQRPITSASASLPSIYSFTLTTLEPLFAINGVFLALFKPQSYLSTMTRDTATVAPDTRFLYTQLAGAWLFFAFVEAVVLRRFDDLRLWRLLCAAMLLSDAAYCHSVAQAEMAVSEVMGEGVSGSCFGSWRNSESAG
ncbi:hypothetical protein NKR19_g8794 [Coniochaeta hoffmannii]|uniref:DUF7704 domain-containing protein n=1 Tax=Coniochaeta hoffmannii TaxID=91930 RepID=A0AA38RML7_9PEZI|nr:hypothetical protein NKR19_g8794 [Coniochaeta hoffmannii]